MWLMDLFRDVRKGKEWNKKQMCDGIGFKILLELTEFWGLGFVFCGMDVRKGAGAKSMSY